MPLEVLKSIVKNKEITKINLSYLINVSLGDNFTGIYSIVYGNTFCA